MAQIKISELDSAGSINGSEYSEIVQAGSNKKVLKSTERTYFQSGLQATLTDGNGTTISGTQVNLGGTISTDTDVQIAFSTFFSIGRGYRSSRTGSFVLWDSNTVDFGYYDQGNNYLTNLRVSPGALNIIGTDPSFPGLTYNDDYSSNFTNRTLVDKEYVDLAIAATGAGTVSTVSVVTANGVSGSVATATTTPAITITLGAITPTSVNGVTISGSASPTLAVTGTTAVSGTNTGDQTSVSGNAGTATALQTGRTISITGDIAYTSPSFDGTGNVTAAGTLATVNSNTGTFGSATQVGSFTVNAKGLITAASSITITPAVGSITGLGSGIATWLATPSWTNFNAAITGTSPFWSLASGGTLTGNVTIAGGVNTFAYTTSPTAGSATSFSHTTTLTGTASAGENLTAMLVDASFSGTTTGDTLNILALRVAGSNAFQFRNNGSLWFGTSAGAAFISPSNATGSPGISGPSLYIRGQATWGTSDGNISHLFHTREVSTVNSVTAFMYTTPSGDNTWVVTATGTKTFIWQNHVPIINVTHATTPSHTFIGWIYNPTLTGVTGLLNHYGLLVVPTACLNGFGTATPNSTVQVNGSLALGYVEKTANYTLTVSDHLVNCTANSFTITLPTAVGCAGRIYVVKNTGAATTITIATTSAQTVDGIAPVTVTTVQRYMSTGANWITF
jgi:hypothetical protein